jgi:hypothetical protein
MTTNTTKSVPATPKSTTPKPLVKVSSAVITFNTAVEQFGSQLAVALSTGESLNACITVMRKTKVKIGSIKSKCQFALSVQTMLKALTYTKQGKPCKLSDQVVANYLSNIRKCLNDSNLVFSTNMARDKAVAKKKAVAPSKGEAPDDIPAVEKTTGDKVKEQLKNALTIIQASETPDFDVVVVTKLLQQALALIK